MEVPRLYKRSDKFMKSGKERSNIVPNSSKHKKPAPTSGVRRSGGASRQTPEEVDEGGIPGRVFKENVDLRHIRELLRHKDCYISENSCGTKKVGLSQGDIEFLSLVLQKAEADDNPGLHVVSTQHKKSKSGECTPPTRRVWAALHRRYAQRWPGLMAGVSSRWVSRSSRT